MCVFFSLSFYIITDVCTGSWEGDSNVAFLSTYVAVIFGSQEGVCVVACSYI